jgi:anti-anti-sigma factor
VERGVERPDVRGPGVERLRWQHRHEDDGVVLVLRGDLDLSTEPVLRTGLREADAARRDGDALLVDLDEVAFCAARGLSVLWEAALRSADGGVPFGLRRCPEHVLHLLDLLALRRLLDVRDAGPSPATR